MQSTIHTPNITNLAERCKSRSDAIESGKKDRDSINLRSFILIKSRRTQLYDFIPGTACILLSDDIPQATYYLGTDARWTSDNKVYFDWQRGCK